MTWSAGSWVAEPAIAAGCDSLVLPACSGESEVPGCHVDMNLLIQEKVNEMPRMMMIIIFIIVIIIFITIYNTNSYIYYYYYYYHSYLCCVYRYSLLIIWFDSANSRTTRKFMKSWPQTRAVWELLAVEDESQLCPQDCLTTFSSFGLGSK